MLLVRRYVIIDEAGAMLEPDTIGCLLHGARALLLVGDHHQLPPFTKWREADRNGYSVSLMERLAKAGMAVRTLTDQYRMHPSICKAVSDAFYEGRLCTATSTASARKHLLPLCFIESGGTEEQPDGTTSFVNIREVQAIVEVVRVLVEHGGHSLTRITVLTFYNAQRTLLDSMLSKAGFKTNVVSVDAMQGRESDVIVLSCVRSGSSLGFLSDWRRINVALSRCREQLVVVGTHSCFKHANWLAKLLRAMTSFSGIAAWTKAYAAQVPSGVFTLSPEELAADLAAVAPAADASEDEWEPTDMDLYGPEGKPTASNAAKCDAGAEFEAASLTGALADVVTPSMEALSLKSPEIETKRAKEPAQSQLEGWSVDEEELEKRIKKDLQKKEKEKEKGKEKGKEKDTSGHEKGKSTGASKNDVLLDSKTIKTMNPTELKAQLAGERFVRTGSRICCIHFVRLKLLECSCSAGRFDSGEQKGAHG